jgi:hypothetical protein
MGRAAELRALRDAEIRVAELEEQLVTEKKDDSVAWDSEQFKATKDALREARREYRTLRDSQPAEIANGDATVQPATIETTAVVKKPGGKS